MTQPYAPREGSLAHRVIAHLTAHNAPLSTAEISQLFGHGKGVSTLLRAAVTAGLLAVTRASARNWVYSLPQEPEPTDGELQIAIYSDGDVSVAGGTPIEPAGLMFTRAQIEQLIRAVTTPHVAVATACPIRSGASLQ